MPERVRFFAPDNIAAELARPDVSPTLQVADQGWARLATSAPELAALAASVHADPGPLVRALEDTPATFLQGDWKMGNLGHHPDGRTILLDWAYPGAGPACWDLCWYLALNRARLPTSKEATIDAFRARLEERGVATDGWWDAQLGALPGRHDGGLRLGEGRRRRRRAALVGAGGAGGLGLPRSLTDAWTRACTKPSLSITAGARTKG